MKKYNKVDLISKLEVRTIELSLKNKCMVGQWAFLDQREAPREACTLSIIWKYFLGIQMRILGTLHMVIQSQASMDHQWSIIMTINEWLIEGCTVQVWLDNGITNILVSTAYNVTNAVLAVWEGFHQGLEAWNQAGPWVNWRTGCEVGFHVSPTNCAVLYGSFDGWARPCGGHHQKQKRGQ